MIQTLTNLRTREGFDQLENDIVVTNVIGVKNGLHYWTPSGDNYRCMGFASKEVEQDKLTEGLFNF